MIPQFREDLEFIVLPINSCASKNTCLISFFQQPHGRKQRLCW